MTPPKNSKNHTQPIDRRGERRTKHYVLTVQDGIPLSVVAITAVDTYDMKNAVEALDNIVMTTRTRTRPVLKKIVQKCFTHLPFTVGSSKNYWNV
jgi:hypothetical protein